MLQHVVHALASEELIRVGGLAEPVEKQGQVVVVVQLLDLDLPSDAVAFGVVV